MLGHVATIDDGADLEAILSSPRSGLRLRSVIARILMSAFSVASRSPARLRVRSAASSGLRQTMSRSPDSLARRSPPCRAGRTASAAGGRCRPRGPLSLARAGR